MHVCSRCGLKYQTLPTPASIFLCMRSIPHLVIRQTLSNLHPDVHAGTQLRSPHQRLPTHPPTSHSAAPAQQPPSRLCHRCQRQLLHILQTLAHGLPPTHSLPLTPLGQGPTQPLTTSLHQSLCCTTPPPPPPPSTPQWHTHPLSLATGRSLPCSYTRRQQQSTETHC